MAKRTRKDHKESIENDIKELSSLCLWNIPLTNSPAPIEVFLEAGQCLFIVGANGSGKSALIQGLVSQLSRENIYHVRYSAHRQSWIDQEANLLDNESEEKNMENVRLSEAERSFRWTKNDDRRKYAYYFHKLISAKISHDQNTENSLHLAGHDHEKIKEATEKDLKNDPIRQFNRLLKQGNLSIEFKLDRKMNVLEVEHSKSGAEFGIREMSDGERFAAIFAATVVTVPPRSVILIDEPEIHLHKNIIEPFFSGLVNHRKDCVFVFSTHDVELACALSSAQIIAVRSCEWTRDFSSSFDAEIISPGSAQFERVKIAILGKRKQILYVEGSLDAKIYRELFPEFLVIEKRGKDSVKRAVTALQDSKSDHHIEAFGIVDRDFDDQFEIDRSIKQKIWILKVHEVESIVYSIESIKAVAHHHRQDSNADVSKMIGVAIDAATSALAEDGVAERMAGHRAAHLTDKEFSQKLPNRKNIGEMGDKISIGEIDNPYKNELENFEMLVEAGDWKTLIQNYPIKSSNAFGKIANVFDLYTGLYEKILVSLLKTDEDLAEKLRQYIHIPLELEEPPL